MKATSARTIVLLVLLSSFGFGAEIFYDSFEDGSIADWTADADWSAGTAINGTYGLFSADSGTTSYATKAVSTPGYTSITVSFYAVTAEMDAAEGFAFSWWTGTAWNVSQAVTAPTTATRYDFTLPSTANNSDFRLNFTCIESGTGGSETCSIDDVRVSGISIIPGNVTIISFNYPNDGTTNSTTENITFGYTPVFYGGVPKNCSIYTNVTGTWSWTAANRTAIVNNSINTIQHNFSANGTTIRWAVGCWDTSMQNFTQGNRTLTIAQTYQTGWLNISYLSPTALSSQNVNQLDMFNVTVNVTCIGGTCWHVTGILRYNSSGGLNPNTKVSKSKTASPFVITNYMNETFIADTAASVLAVGIGDADNDGLNEVVIGTADELRMYKNVSGGWVETIVDTVSIDIRAIAIGDADNDGLNEVVAGMNIGSDNVRAYENTSGSWSWKSIGTLDSNVRDVEIGDADNDGLNEVLTSRGQASGDGYEITLFDNVSGTWVPNGVRDRAEDAPSVAFGDVDNDGANEIIAAWYPNTDNNDVEVYENVSGGWSAVVVESTYAIKFMSVAIGDMDNDGMNEFTLASGTNGMMKYKNQSGGWVLTTYASSYYPYGMIMGDANNDGYMDVIIASSYSSTAEFRLYENNSGNQTTTDMVDYSVSAPCSAVGDMDNDGVNEVAIGLYSTSYEVRGYDISTANPLLCGNLASGETCTVSWAVNATGNGGRQYWLDVNFTSSYSLVSPNESGNFQINITDWTGPNIASLTSNVSNMSLYFPTQGYQFNATVNDTGVGLDDVWIEHNFTGAMQNITVTTSSGSRYYYNAGILPAGYYYIKWWANDTSNNLNSSHGIYYKINATGWLNISYLSPAAMSSQNVNQLDMFNVTVNVTCIGGSCGNVTIGVYYNKTSPSPDMAINTTAGNDPFFTYTYRRYWGLNLTFDASLDDVGTYSAPAMAFIGDRWNLISGNYSGLFTGWTWNGTTWVDNGSLVNGLDYVGTQSTPAIAYIGDGWNLISGNSIGMFTGWTWDGTTWVDNGSLVNGLDYDGNRSAPAMAYIGNRWNLISGNTTGIFVGWTWNGTVWQDNTSLVNGLYDTGFYSTPTMVYMDGTLELFSGNYDGDIYAWKWTGATWQSDNGSIEGLGTITWSSSPTVAYIGNRWNLITGDYIGTFTSYTLSLLGTMKVGIMNESQTASFLWEVNATGGAEPRYWLDVRASSHLTQVPANDSGDFQVNISEGSQGTLSAELVTPTAALSTLKYRLFNVTARVSCSGSNCGLVNGTLYYNLTTALPGTVLNTTAGDRPFYTNNSNPYECGNMNSGQSCDASWLANATGDFLTEWLLKATFNSNESTIAPTSTSNFRVTIDPITYCNSYTNCAYPECLYYSDRITDITTTDYSQRVWSRVRKCWT